MIHAAQLLPDSDPLRDELASSAVTLACDIVDVAGYLDQVDGEAAALRQQLAQARAQAELVDRANTEVIASVDLVSTSAEATMGTVTSAVKALRETDGHTRTVAEWVQHVDGRMAEIESTLNAVLSSNNEISSIAAQVNILAINAKIEAARAGDAGRGFAVVAEAINDLSRKTAAAAETIGDSIAGLTQRIESLRGEAGTIAVSAGEVLRGGAQTDAQLTEMTRSVEGTRGAAREISSRAQEVRQAHASFNPSFQQVIRGVNASADQVHEARERVDALISLSEGMVQGTVALGGASEDAGMIAMVQDAAARIGAAFSEGVARGAIPLQALFDQRYKPVAGTDPVQTLAPYTRFCDQVLPALQEPILALDPRVVFAACVDRNGYLPTHNRKFSAPPSGDPVWDAANCRNRRMFNDRVGLRAGQSTAPFVLQVYRRDMGGGAYVLLKDVSAPIFVEGRHWGGLRIAYSL
jgi:methyl-accepting chemotaxis protein